MTRYGERKFGFSDQGTRIIVAGGWSPGPLGHLLSVQNYSNNNEISVVEPRNLNRWMPPFPGTWCCHPFVLLVLFFLVATTFLAVTADVGLFLRFIIVALALAWCRLLVAVVVRTSIESSIQIVMRDEKVNEDTSNRTLIIGFSWGGAVVAEMIARGRLGGGSLQPSVLLIAPTTSLVSKMALQKDTALRIAELPVANADGSTPKITVVHGQYDAAFCPNQDRWNSILGVDLLVLPDNHVFLRSSSLRALAEVIQGQLGMMDHDNVT